MSHSFNSYTVVTAKERNFELNLKTSVHSRGGGGPGFLLKVCNFEVESIS